MKALNKIIFATAIFSLLLMYACEKKYPDLECNYNIHIPDTAFKNALINTWVVPVVNVDYEGDLDNNHDGEICDGEAAWIVNLVISDSNIRDIEGIEHFINLKSLEINGCNIESIAFNNNSLLRFDCSENSLTYLDVSKMKNLKDLECNNNLLTNLDVSNLKNLEDLSCEGNKLTELNLSKNTQLRGLKCGNNLIDSIDFSNLNLGILHIDNNNFNTINVNNLAELFSLHFNGNQISAIDISNNIELTTLNFTGNPISEIDLSNNPNLNNIWFGNNPMTVLDISGNQKVNYLRNEGEFPLEKICVWTLPFPPAGIDPYFGFQMINFPDSFDGFEICD